MIHPWIVEKAAVARAGNPIWRNETTKHEGTLLYYKLWNFWVRAGVDADLRSSLFFRDYEVGNRDTNKLLADIGFPWKKAETEEQVWDRIGQTWKWLQNKVQNNNTEYGTVTSVPGEWPSIVDYARYYATHGHLVWAACFSKAHFFVALLGRMVYPRYRFAIAQAHHTENGAPRRRRTSMPRYTWTSAGSTSTLQRYTPRTCPTLLTRLPSARKMNMPRHPIEAIYMRFTPMVVQESRTTDVVLEVSVKGAPTAVTIQLESTGTEIPLRDDGTGSDKVAGDSVYTVTLEATGILHSFTPDDVNRNFVGYLRLYRGRELNAQYNVFADILTSNIPPVGIRMLSRSVQYTEHLVNIVDPGFFGTFSIPTITSTFYTYFGDGYDFVNVIYEIPHFRNRHHLGIRNDIQGIGIQQFNNTAVYGSAGRLLGCSVFPIPTFFDGASPDYQHELGHQWINFLSVSPLDYAIPHWPLSDLASGLMGWGEGKNTQGLNADNLCPSPNYPGAGNALVRCRRRIDLLSRHGSDPWQAVERELHRPQRQRRTRSG